MAAPTTTAKSPTARPLARHIARNATTGSLLTLLVTLLIAALAVSRATAHVLSALALALIVAGAAAGGILVGWANGLYNGAFDVIRGAAILDCEPGCSSEPDEDPWLPRELYRTTAAWAAAVAVWAGAGTALVAVALDGKRARLIVVFVALAGLAGAASIVVDAVARHRGAHAARVVRAMERTPVTIRHRAWVELALPIGLAVFAVNAAAACMLFHDYTTHPTAAAAAGGKVLTHTAALADVALLITLVAVIFGVVATLWGTTDALLGRVTPDDPGTQRTSVKSPVGPQGVVYIALLALLLAKLVDWLLPSFPSLLDVALARGAFAGVLAFAAAGFSYVRGAVNGRALAATPPEVQP